MLLNYLKHRISYIILFVIIGSVFFLISYLSNLNFEANFYSVLICFTVYLIIAVIDFCRFNSKISKLELMKEDFSPDANRDFNFVEENCLEIAKNQHELLLDTIQRNNQSLNEIKDFYSMWVHQVKTPISAMNLSLEQSNTPRDKILKEELFKIDCYTEMVTNFIRSENISDDLVIRHYNLEIIINKLIKKYAPIFISKSISIKLENLDKIVLTDEKWLAVSLEQIISNALKYTKVKGSITIRLQSDILSVKDNGIGISDEDLPRIFEKGFTGYNGRWDNHATGLGLYLSKRILTKLENKISVNSKENVGTEVLIDLKRKEQFFE